MEKNEKTDASNFIEMADGTKLGALPEHLRLAIIAALAAYDENGVWSDADLIANDLQPMTSEEALEKLAEIGREEIRMDIERKAVPPFPIITCFEDLHVYTDPNEYGLADYLASQIDNVEGQIDKVEDLALIMNHVQARLDKWIRAGMPAEPHDIPAEPVEKPRMKRGQDLGLEDAQNLISDLQNIFYRDVDVTADEDIWNPEKEWSVDHLDEIHQLMTDYDLDPPCRLAIIEDEGEATSQEPLKAALDNSPVTLLEAARAMLSALDDGMSIPCDPLNPRHDPIYAALYDTVRAEEARLSRLPQFATDPKLSLLREVNVLLTAWRDLGLIADDPDLGDLLARLDKECGS